MKILLWEIAHIYFEIINHEKEEGMMRADNWKQKSGTVEVLHRIGRCRIKDAGTISVRGPTKIIL
ncbi:MAG TPA: hypothetical protein DDY31_09190 [Lachnospiraceae bacterium]|nr:hypothetical protein [Lachnospiraceae bacterium]